MKTFYITSVALVLASLSCAQSSAPRALADARTGLEANGVNFDMPYRNVHQTGFAVAFLTDLRGTRIELTEKPAAAPAQQ